MSKVTKAQLVLGCLQMAANNGDPWVSFRRLNNICFRYGARIYELREAGHEIDKKRMHNVWYYRLKPQQERRER
jgi:predicted alpha/beta hydrolase family esterase